MKLGNKYKIAFKIIISLILLLTVLTILISVKEQQFNNSDDHGRLQAQLTERIRETLGIWAIIKGISAIISTMETIQVEAGVSFGAQSTVSINPVGGLAVVDNILDQVSNILLWAIGSLSALKILLAVSIWVSLKIILPVCCILIIAVIWNKKYYGQLKIIIAGIIIICLGICLAVPFSLEMSNVVKNSILLGKIHRTTNEITNLSEHIGKESNEINNPSFLNMINKGLKSITTLFHGIKHYIDRLIENIIDYIMIFIIVNIIIPIASLFGLKAIVGAILKYIGFTMENLKRLNVYNQKSIPAPVNSKKI